MKGLLKTNMIRQTTRAVPILVFVFTFCSSGVATDLDYFAFATNSMMPICNATVLSTSQQSLIQCAKTCRQHGRVFTQTGTGNKYVSLPCQAFEYIEKAGVCMLLNIQSKHHGNAGFMDLRPAVGTSYFEKSKSQLSLFTKSPGHAFSGELDYFRLLNATSAEQCANACLETHGPDCNSFAHNRKRELCALSMFVWDKEHALMETNAYDFYAYFGNWPCNLTIPSNYSPNVLASPGYPFLEQTRQDCFINLVPPPGTRIVITVMALTGDRTLCSDRKAGIFIYGGAKGTQRICEAYNTGHLPHAYGQVDRNVTIVISQGESRLVTRMTYDYEGCRHDSCKNGGTCHVTNDNYTCSCAIGFSGLRCEVKQKSDHCKMSPCLFDGHCLSETDGYTCNCLPGTTGQHCEIYLGECHTQPCRNGTCFPASILSGYTCDCTVGFTGTNCEYDVNECFSSPCVHGKCIDIINGYACSCYSGFSGVDCSLKDGEVECSPRDCKFGTCAINVSGSYCQCFPGFTGAFCELNIDECRNSPCVHGLCSDHVNTFDCKCYEGYEGQHCDILSNDPCRHNPCAHGYCSVSGGGFQCVCSDGFSGKFCDIVTFLSSTAETTRVGLPVTDQILVHGTAHTLGPPAYTAKPLSTSTIDTTSSVQTDDVAPKTAAATFIQTDSVPTNNVTASSHVVSSNTTATHKTTLTSNALTSANFKHVSALSITTSTVSTKTTNKAAAASDKPSIASLSTSPKFASSLTVPTKAAKPTSDTTNTITDATNSTPEHTRVHSTKSTLTSVTGIVNGATPESTSSCDDLRQCGIGHCILSEIGYICLCPSGLFMRKTCEASGQGTEKPSHRPSVVTNHVVNATPSTVDGAMMSSNLGSTSTLTSQGLKPLTSTYKSPSFKTLTSTLTSPASNSMTSTFKSPGFKQLTTLSKLTTQQDTRGSHGTHLNFDVGTASVSKATQPHYTSVKTIVLPKTIPIVTTTSHSPGNIASISSSSKANSVIISSTEASSGTKTTRSDDSDVPYHSLTTTVSEHTIETHDNVITLESVLIGALAASLLAVILVALVLFYRRSRSGTVYISPPCESHIQQKKEDTNGVKKRHSSRDIYTELKAGRYFNANFSTHNVNTQPAISRSTDKRKEAMSSSTESSTTHSPKSSSSGSRTDQYEPIQNHVIISTSQSEDSSGSRDNVPYSSGMRQQPLKTKPPTGRPKSKLKIMNRSTATTTQATNPFYELDDGSFGLNLNKEGKSLSPEEFQSVLDQVLVQGKHRISHKQGTRQKVHITGAEFGKSEA